MFQKKMFGNVFVSIRNTCFQTCLMSQTNIHLVQDPDREIKALRSLPISLVDTRLKFGLNRLLTETCTFADKTLFYKLSTL